MTATSTPQNLTIELPDAGGVYGLQLPHFHPVSGVDFALDVNLTPRNGDASDIKGNAPRTRLEFLAFVYHARIPLHLIAGPSLQVAGSDAYDVITACLVDFLGNAVEGDTTNGRADLGSTQLAVGILFRVQDEGIPIKEDVQFPITEMLLYFERDFRGLAENGLTAEDSNRRILYALPLSSHLLYTASSIPTTPIPPANDSKTKEDKLSSLFDQAADRRKRAKRKGGQSVALAASKGNAPTQVRQDQPETAEDSLPGVGAAGLENTVANANILQGRHRSKPFLQKPPRPPSRGLEPRKRSSLSQVTKVDDILDESSFEERNKKTISKTVMACMRMHGLQQRKNETQRFDDVDSQALDASGDDEYKGIYHQTYKGTVFTFVSPIPPQHLCL